MNKPWLAHYPAGVAATIDVAAYGSLVELLDAAFDELGDLAIVRGHLSDRVRLHVSTKHRHDLEDLW